MSDYPKCMDMREWVRKRKRLQEIEKEIQSREDKE